MSVIEVKNAGKQYRIYRRPHLRIFDLLSLPQWPTSPPRFREFWALKNINLSIEPGERIGIIGRNGAGKTTLLKMICNRLEATEGEVSVRGNVHAILELGTGFYPEFTGRENIKAAFAYQDVAAELYDSLIEEIAEFSELWEYLDQPVKTYSAGMYARLAFATATALKPDVLIIDEVMGAGDASFVAKCAARMKKLTSEGTTLLFVSHSMALVERFCERAILLVKGEIVADGPSLQIGKKYNAMIRREEEINLLAMSGGIRKRKLLPTGMEQPKLFRFCVAGNAPLADHFIQQISLCNKDECLAEIQVGQPMDDQTDGKGCLLIDPGYLNWSDVDTSNVTGRWFKNLGGRYGHAPFQFTLPESIYSEDTQLKIIATIAPQETVFCDIFSEEKWQRLGELTSSQTNWIFSLQKIFSNKNSAKMDDSIYGSHTELIKSMNAHDETGRSRRIFTTGETLSLSMSLAASPTIINNVTLVFCLYYEDSTPVCQVFETGDLVDHEQIVTATFSPLRFGRGTYHVSAAIFEDCNMQLEEEETALCLLDRALTLKIEQPEGICKEFGRFHHPVSWNMEDSTEVNIPPASEKTND